ncbi:MAG: acyltransferase family protein [Pseudomonadota bacterium]
MGQASSSQQGAYRHDIDGLRAVAVLGVIVSHIEAALLPSGYLGVDMFFVISGFVITSSIMRDQSPSFTVFLLSFYQRRVKRLVPALVFFVAVLSICLALVDELVRPTLLTGAAAVFGVSNVYLAFNGTDYFSPSADLNGFLHTWSLGVEEQFYLIFPILFWCVLDQTRTTLRQIVFFGLIFLGSVISLALFVSFYARYQTYAYYLLPTRFWELGAGALTYALCARTSALSMWLRRIPAMAPLMMLGIAFFLPAQFAVVNTGLVVVLTMLIIICARDGTLFYRIMTLRPIVFVGLISYSLYLWHWGVLTLARLTFGVHLSTIPILLVLMFALASFSYFVIERPLRHRSWSASRLGTIAIGGVASAICLVWGLTLSFVSPQISLAKIYGYDLSHLEQTWWEDRKTGTYLETCHVERVYDSALLDICLPQTGPSDRRVFVVGDSHARNYVPTVQAAFPGHHLSYLTMGYGCAFLPTDLSQSFDHVNCPAYVEDSALRITETVREGDIVFIGQRLLGNPQRWSANYVEFLDRQAQAFLARGALVVLLDGTYPPDEDPRFCVDLPWRPDRTKCTTTREDVQAAFAPYDDLAQALAQRTEGLFYSPLRSGLCGQMQCGQRAENGTPIWHDVGHITETAARSLAPFLQDQLTAEGFDRALFSPGS